MCFSAVDGWGKYITGCLCANVVHSTLHRKVRRLFPHCKMKLYNTWVPLVSMPLGNNDNCQRWGFWLAEERKGRGELTCGDTGTRLGVLVSCFSW